MGLFDEKVDKKAFDQFQAELQSRMQSLELAIQQKVTDSEAIAHAAAENALESEAKTKASEASVREVLAVLASCKDLAQSTVKGIEKELV